MLFGVADITTVFMILTGIRIFYLAEVFTAVLLVKAFLSFKVKNPALWFFGIVDLTAVVLLWSSFSFGIFNFVLMSTLLLKGLLSFWKMDFFRNALVGTMSFVAWFLIKNSKNVSKNHMKDRIANYLWFGTGKIVNNRYENPEFSPPRNYSYKFLETLSEN